MAGKEMTAQDVVAYIKDRGVKMVDLKFVDVVGTWQHTTVPASKVDEKSTRSRKSPRCPSSATCSTR